MTGQITSETLAASNVAAYIAAVAVLRQTVSSQDAPGTFRNPAVVASAIKTRLQKSISDPSSQGYVAGLTVVAVVCTIAGNDTDNCLDTFSTGRQASETAVISADGHSYVTR